MLVIALLFVPLVVLLPTTQGQTNQYGAVAIGGVANFTLNAPPSSINCLRRNNTMVFDNMKYALVHTSTGSTNLTIYNVVMDDNGVYTCILNGVAVATNSLFVVEPIVMSVTQVTFNLYDNVTITCKVTYYLDANLLPSPDQDLVLSLTLNGVELLRDTQLYNFATSTRSKNLTFYGNSNVDMKNNNVTCMLKNSVFWEKTSQRVYINYPPGAANIANKSMTDLYPGNTIYCSVDSYPLLSVTWKALSLPSSCSNPPTPYSLALGSATLTMTVNCLGQQTWSCSAVWTDNILIVNDTFTFNVVGANSNSSASLDAMDEKRKRDIGLGVGLGLGIPLLILLIALIVFFCRGKNTTKKAPPQAKTQPSSTTKQASPVKINNNPNPNGLPTYNQVAKSGNGNVRGSPGVPDIGVAHLNGSGSIPQLNSSLDPAPLSFRNDQINFGKADLGYQNRSFTNI